MVASVGIVCVGTFDYVGTIGCVSIVGCAGTHELGVPLPEVFCTPSLGV